MFFALQMTCLLHKSSFLMLLEEEKPLDSRGIYNPHNYRFSTLAISQPLILILKFV